MKRHALPALLALLLCAHLSDAARNFQKTIVRDEEALISEAAAVAGLVRDAAKRGHPSPAPVTYSNDKPLIGILTQPCSECPGKSYVAASYVKWIESAGGRAVPIRFYASDEELARLFNSINGLIFPGGLTWLWLDAPYVIAARKLFNMAVAANDKGDVFPIHGTCLGFQLLHILVSNVSRNDLLVDTDSVAHLSTLDWTDATDDSRMFGRLPDDLRRKLADPRVNLAIQNHMYGIPPPFYDRWPILAKWFDIVSTSDDRNGTTYVSSMEAKDYPFQGTQWHPEKYATEFALEVVPHTLDAVRVAQHLANGFIDTARRSAHAPASHEEELAMVIYGTAPIFSARDEVFGDENYDGPYQTFYFDKHEEPPIGPDDDGGDDVRARATATHRRPQRASLKSMF